tara:strand:+ start:320 stop:586 length:267 start_codon:yes stop_codon:yes gene_type:complete
MKLKKTRIENQLHKVLIELIDNINNFSDELENLDLCRTDNKYSVFNESEILLKSDMSSKECLIFLQGIYSFCWYSIPRKILKLKGKIY